MIARGRAAAILAGATPILCFPAPSLWWSAWFLLLPWLILIRRAPTAREAALRGWCGGFGFLVAVHYWLLASLTVFLPLAAAALALLWMPWAALTWRVLSGRLSAGRLAAGVVVVPAGWVLIEAVRSWSALGGPWGVLGASQWRAPALLAPASLGGVWLVSFLIVAVNVALLVAVESVRTGTRLAAVGCALAIVAVGPIWFHAEPAPRGDGALRLAVVQAGVVHSASQRLQLELAATNHLPPGQFDLVVWGESSVGFDLDSHQDVQRQLQIASARVGADLLVNVDAQAPNGAIRKTAVLIGPAGILATYQKIRLVPFGEYIPLRQVLGWLPRITNAAAVNRERGHQLVVMHADGVAFAPLICFETAFPDMSRAAARDGAQLLVFQSATTTFQGTWAPRQQASLAAVRAAETGRPAISATLAGTTAAFDAQGRQLLWWPAATGTEMVRTPLAARTTPFDRYGNWVLVGSLVVVVSGVVGLYLRPRVAVG